MLCCHHDAGQRAGIDTHKVPVLLFTDHYEFRQFVLEGRLVGGSRPEAALALF
jgi:hypothetical protein